jgi:D-3-phosphoglycerate dehydrogenase
MVEVGRKYVFDFDSTLTRVEALDVLAEITLKDKANKNEIISEIQKITNLGIDGDISFTESLEYKIIKCSQGQPGAFGFRTSSKDFQVHRIQ